MARKRIRDIRQQLLHTVNKNFKEKMDKDSIKKEEKTNNTRIYSYADRRNLVKFTSNIAHFLKDKHPEVRLATEIKSEHVQEFLNLKAQTCSKATIDQYVSKANKMQNLINKTFGSNNKLVLEIPKAKREVYRDKQLSLEHYKTLEKSIKNKNILNAIQAAKNFGLRVEDISCLRKGDIDLNNKTVNVIDSKGGRDRTVKLKTKEQLEVAQKLYNSKAVLTDRIIPILPDSINRGLNRALTELGIKEEYKNTGIHSVRKLYAQEEFNRCRNKNMSIEKARSIVSEQLGHSKERGKDDELMKTYVKSLR
ncbi:MAG: tyrosine-type recombinase/integrase [Sarcina sp.]